MFISSIFVDRFPRQAGLWLLEERRAAPSQLRQHSEAAIHPDLSVHPTVILAALGCCAWFLVLAWSCFAAFDLETGLAVAVVSVIWAIYLGGIALGATYSAGNRPALGGRTFRQFLRGRVDTATGLISGREAMVQIVALPLGLALGGTVMALIWVAIRVS